MMGIPVNSTVVAEELGKPVYSLSLTRIFGFFRPYLLG